MTLDVTDWLRGLGLEQYASAFRDNAIDAEVLQSLTAEDLREIGVTLVGHRRRLLDAIAALRSQASSTADPDAAAEPSSTPALAAIRTINRCRTSAADRHVLRSCRLDRTFDPARSRGTEQRPRRVSKGLCQLQ